MMEQYTIVARRCQPDGRELLLVQDEREEKRLWIPRVVGKDKIRLEILRRLKEAVTPDVPAIEGYYPLLNALPYEDGIVLEIRYDESLWEGWEEGLNLPATPEATVRWFQTALKTLEAFDMMGLSLRSIHPADMLPMKSGTMGLLDPRISGVISQIHPLDPPQEFYYSPEVLEGKPWTPAATLYSMGLNAYTVLSGSFPFGDGEKAEITRSILQEKPLDIRYLVPEVSKALARLLEKLLSKDRAERPSVLETTDAIQQMVEGGSRATENEIGVFKEQSQRAIGKREKVRQLKRVWRLGRWGVAVLVFIILGLFWAQPGYKPILTPKTSPGQVVDHYYQALSKLDVMRLDEMLAKGVGKDIEDMVTWSYVLSLYHPTGQPRKVIVLKDLLVTPGLKTPVEAKFSASYIMEIYSAKQKKTQHRVDQLVVRRVKKVYQIVGLVSKVTSEEKVPWEEE